MAVIIFLAWMFKEVLYFETYGGYQTYTTAIQLWLYLQRNSKFLLPWLHSVHYRLILYETISILNQNIGIFI